MATRTERRSRRVSTSRSLLSVPATLAAPKVREREAYLLDQEAEGPAAASDKDRQREFGQVIGLVSTSVVIPPDYTAITEKVITDASGHTFFEAYVTDTCDGYFTIEGAGRAALQSVRGETVTMCDCHAHQFLNSPGSWLQKEDVKLLIRSQEPITDDAGKLFGMSLIRLVMSFASMEGPVQAVSMGSEWSVSFCLLQGDNLTHYRGFPDFIVRRDGSGATFVIIGVGEAQSNEKDAVLQGGIYAVGQLLKRDCREQVSCIAVHNNKSVNIMVANVSSRSTSAHISPRAPISSSTHMMGCVTYKYVIDTMPLNTKDLGGVILLANRIVWTLTTS